VGRQSELGEIDRALGEALAGQGRLVMLAGEPGIGKTRLCDEATAAAAARGALVLWGRCWESGGAPAYWPWLDVVAGLARALDDRALGEALAEGGSLVAELCPELRARLGESPAVVPPNAAEARFRLWRAVGALVRRAATGKGLCLVLDDLHAADESSLLLLHFLSRELRTARALVLATYRDVEARLQPAAGELLARIGREGTTVALRRLDSEAAGRFVRARAGAVEPEVQARIFASTQGNPLFLEEMTRLYAEEGAAAVTAGALPHGVREVIGQRLERVPGDARPLLDLAAVAGDEIDAALVQAASGRSEAEVATTLAAAVRAGVLVDRGGRRLRFFHALVREVLYRQIPPDARRALHAQVAEALASLYGADANPPLAELAHHTIEGLEAGAGAAEARARAVDFAVRAAVRAQALLAYEEAVAGLARAAEAVQAAGNSPALQGRVLLALGEARIRRGEAGRGKADCLEAAACARKIPDPELLARAALMYGRVYTFAAVDPMLVALLQEAVAALPPGDSALRVGLMARLAAALQPSPRSDEPVRLAHEAIAGARRLGDPETLLATLFSGMSALMFVVPPQERLALNLEAERLATQLGDRECLLHTHLRLALDQMEAGELAAADTRMTAFETLVDQLRAPWHAWKVPFFKAMRAIFHGRFAEAEQLAASALRIGIEAKDPQAERCWTLQRDGLLRAWEQHDAMLAFEPQVRRARTTDWRASAWQAAGTALLYSRREDEANTRLYLELVPEEMRPPMDSIYGLYFISEPAARVGSLELCQRLFDLSLRRADRDIFLGFTYTTWEGTMTRLLAMLAERLGRRDEASGYFEAAIARIERLGAAPYLARTRYEYGRALIERGDPSLHERARGLVGSARDLGVSLGLTGLVALAERRLAGLGAGPVVTAGASGAAEAPPPPAAERPAAAGGVAAPPFTLAPEGEYWSIAFQGKTFRLKDSLGLQYLARLLATPDREIHVLELAGGRLAAEEQPVDSGDAGELLDDDARQAYRHRLEDLRESLEEAESFGDAARAARAREEIEFLGAELGRAVGLGGRSRRAGAASERARSAVQRRLRNVIERIGEQSPALAALLTRAVRTGTFCSFRSNPDGPPA
jgi:tetratricopeptide (TPR) repeat protein